MKPKTNDQRRDDALEIDLRWLVPLAKDVADRAGDTGIITVENIRLAAENRGLLFAQNDRGYLSRLFGQVMRRADLELVKGVRVRTPRRGKKGGNDVAGWRRRAA